MRSILLLTVVLTGACASSGATPEATALPQRTQSVAGLRIRGSTSAKEYAVTGTVDQVWRALPAVYDSLGIQLSDVDATQHVLGNSGMKAYKKLANVSLSKYIDCGRAQGFPSADTYQLTMAVRTQAYVNEQGIASVSTLVEASGRPMAFSGEIVTCSSTGNIEKEIADRTTKMLSP